jgi:prolyl-tRNA synthetase
MPVITGRKPEHDKFPGALRTYCIEAMMQDKKSLQAGTSHNLGQNFAKAFDIKFTNKQNESQFVWQTSWGVSTRLIGGLIMTHSDDKGLVLPPEIAPIKIIIIPIYKTKEEFKIIHKNISIIKEDLLSINISFETDYRDNINPGVKFNEWEKKGVPLRVEIGPKDVERKQVVLVRRDSGEKKFILISDLKKMVSGELRNIQNNLLLKAMDFRKRNSFIIDDYDEIIKILKQQDGGYIYSHWCGEQVCEEKIKSETKASIRCLALDQKDENGKCVVCGKKSERRVIFAKAY